VRNEGAAASEYDRFIFSESLNYFNAFNIRFWDCYDIGRHFYPYFVFAAFIFVCWHKKDSLTFYDFFFFCSDPDDTIHVFSFYHLDFYLFLRDEPE